MAEADPRDRDLADADVDEVGSDRDPARLERLAGAALDAPASPSLAARDGEDLSSRWHK